MIFKKGTEGCSIHATITWLYRLDGCMAIALKFTWHRYMIQVNPYRFSHCTLKDEMDSQRWQRGLPPLDWSEYI